MDKNWDNYKLMIFSDRRLFENMFTLITLSLDMYSRGFDWYPDNSKLTFKNCPKSAWGKEPYLYLFNSLSCLLFIEQMVQPCTMHIVGSGVRHKWNWRMHLQNFWWKSQSNNCRKGGFVSKPTQRAQGRKQQAL